MPCLTAATQREEVLPRKILATESGTPHDDCAMNRLLSGKKRKFTVLLGDQEPGITNGVLSCLAHVSRHGDEMVVVAIARPERLLEYAHNQKFDLCILVLNNIVFPIIPWSARKRNVLNLVGQLKRACLAPIIAVAGVREDVSLPEEAERAGARCFLWMPFTAAEFMEAVKKCLSEKDDSAQSA